MEELPILFAGEGSLFCDRRSQINRNFNYMIFLKRSPKTCCKRRVSGLFLIWVFFRGVRVNWDLADPIVKIFQFLAIYNINRKMMRFTHYDTGEWVRQKKSWPKIIVRRETV